LAWRRTIASRRRTEPLRLTILHTNDIHGRQERIAQIATLVERERARADHPVLYLDAGDVEETTNRLSNLTKGTAMHRLLSVAGCDAATVGNACWLRYGPATLTEHARVSTYPQLLANFTGIDGPVPSVLLGELGIVGVTDPFDRMADDLDWGFDRRDVLESVKTAANELRARGAQLVLLLSHLGYEHEFPPWDDGRIAPQLQDDVDMIVGAHSHHLLPGGEWIGRILVAQAGCYGEHIGRIEIDGDRIIASVEPVPEDTEPHPAVLAEATRIASEVDELLAEPLGALDEPLDARAIAEILRARAGADVGLFSEGQTLAVLPAGPVTRGALWDASESAANPGLTRMTGEQLLELLERGNERSFQDETPRPLRGRPRGRLELAGAAPRAGRDYVVASTDWELAPYGGYVPEDWQLRIAYEFPLIVREAIEEHLRGGR
jgi:2',3'-cyclic-nucleotide 2'-phosphodiesterase (5'-nucleotidase family)